MLSAVDAAPRRFLIAAPVSLVAGGAVALAQRAGRFPAADPLHIAAIGTAAFALGFFLVRTHPHLAPDPAQRKGVAPRAFWTLALGVAIRGMAGAGHDPAQERFLAELSLAGVLLEAAALAMLLYGAFPGARGAAKNAIGTPPQVSPPASPEKPDDDAAVVPR